MSSYDSWKTRSDRDENPEFDYPEFDEELEEDELSEEEAITVSERKITSLNKSFIDLKVNGSYIACPLTVEQAENLANELLNLAQDIRRKSDDNVW
jgi:hypothetical protein